jgi:hypothetical protein
MEWWQAVLMTAGICLGLYGVAWSLAWLFEMPGFERPDRGDDDA